MNYAYTALNNDKLYCNARIYASTSIRNYECFVAISRPRLDHNLQ
jgi:hypothetical protein